MKMLRFFIAITAALPLLSSPVRSQENDTLCIRGKERVIDGLSKNWGGYIVLMRHAEAQCTAGTTQTKPEGCLGKSDRHLCKTGQAEYMADEIKGVLGASGKPFRISAVMTSQICRAIETANLIRPLLDRKLDAPSPQPALNPIAVQIKALESSAELTKEEAQGLVLGNSVEWIKQLVPDPGEIIILVSHSDIIPELVPRLDDNGRKLSGTLANTESIFLRKTDRGFSCVAAVPSQ